MKQFQFGQVVLRVVLRQEGQLHQPAMHHQEHQHVHRPVPGVVELLLLDRPWDRPADRVTLQDLEGRDLIDTHHPDALFGQPRRIGIAPKDLLRSLLELRAPAEPSSNTESDGAANRHRARCGEPSPG